MVLNLGNPVGEPKAKNSTEHSVGWFFRRMYTEMSFGFTNVLLILPRNLQSQ